MMDQKSSDDGAEGEKKAFHQRSPGILFLTNTQNDEIHVNGAIHATHVIRAQRKGYRYLTGEAGAHALLTASYR